MGALHSSALPERAMASDRTPTNLSSRVGSIRREAPRYGAPSVALTQPGVREVSLTGIGADGGSSGAYISNSEQSLEATGTIRCPAASLDDLFSSTISSADRSLLKLDLEGHELQALKGAIQLLERIEVVVCEVAFFDINDGGRPLFTDISEFLLRHSFVLFDLASLNGRRRDERLRTGDAIYARKNSFLVRDNRFD